LSKQDPKIVYLLNILVDLYPLLRWRTAGRGRFVWFSTELGPTSTGDHTHSFLFDSDELVISCGDIEYELDFCDDGNVREAIGLMVMSMQDT
jgi:hypothetical protein